MVKVNVINLSDTVKILNFLKGGSMPLEEVGWPYGKIETSICSIAERAFTVLLQQGTFSRELQVPRVYCVWVFTSILLFNIVLKTANTFKCIFIACYILTFLEL
jgi:hypothetical protein